MPSRIDREALHARMSGVDRPVLIEALGTDFYLDAHLPGAINIPPTHVDALAPTLIPDLAADIVVYGTSTCTSSDAVAQRLEDLGYRSVSVYPGGKEDWAEHGLPLERLDPDAA